MQESAYALREMPQMPRMLHRERKTMSSLPMAKNVFYMVAISPKNPVAIELTAIILGILIYLLLHYLVGKSFLYDKEDFQERSLW